MSGDVQLELYLHEYKMTALSSVLAEQDSSVEERMQEMLIDLYAELVPHEVQREIRARIDAEYAAEQAAREAARKYTVFHLRENGSDMFFQMDRQMSFLNTARFLRQYLRDAQEQSPPRSRIHSPAWSLSLLNSMSRCWLFGWTTPTKSPTCLIWTLINRKSPS